MSLHGRGRLAAVSDAPELRLSSTERGKPLKILEERNSITIGVTKIPGLEKWLGGRLMGEDELLKQESVNRKRCINMEGCVKYHRRCVKTGGYSTVIVLV